MERSALKMFHSARREDIIKKNVCLLSRTSIGEKKARSLCGTVAKFSIEDRGKFPNKWP
jgi:hypothetical protein